jgi:hypothetical protein
MAYRTLLGLARRLLQTSALDADLLMWVRVRDLAGIKVCRSSMANEHRDDEEFTQDAIEGKYANYFEIGHNAFELLLDFGQKYSSEMRARMHTRIVTGPSYAKELLRVLERSIEQYEQTFGTIRQDE